MAEKETGKKTSVWMGARELAAWKDSGASLTEIVKRGLAAIAEDEAAPVPDLAAEVKAIREELAALPDEVRIVVRAEIARLTSSPA